MLKRSVIASGLLHAAIIVAATVAWPTTYEPADETPPVVPIELVTISEVSNIAPTVEEPKPQQLVSVEPPAVQEQILTPPLEPVEVAPEPLDEKKPEPLPKPKPAEEKTASTAPANPAVPRRKPQQQPQQKFDVDSVLALLDKRAPAKPAAPPANAKVAEQTVKGLGAQDSFTLDLKDALLAQMRECWNVPVGAPNPEQLIVQVRVFLLPDGGLARSPQLEAATRSAMGGSPYMRTAAEAALRAVNVCAPYKRLPPDRYDSWREIVMTFDPSKMIGR
jgi:hypothetical protein